MVILSHRINILFICLFVFKLSIANAGSPVLLTFDTEKSNDEAYLKELNIQVPATYFFLGKFIEQHSDFVTEISKNNTVGSHAYSHANLKDLSPTELHQELMLTKVLLEKATGKPPKWFRAPFLEYNQEVLTQLKKLGFLYDSSEQERWTNQSTLLEMPVSGVDGNNNLISDYDVLVRDKLSDEEALNWYKQQYLEKSKTGRPMVFLLHPSIIVEHKEVLWQFIDFVKNQGGSFITSDQWVERFNTKTAKRIGVWIDLSIGEHKIEQLIADIKGIGVTDAFLMAKDHEGHAYFDESVSHEVDTFGDIQRALHQAGIKVHAWLPVLLNPAVAQLHPEWAMVADNTSISTEWLSPFNPEVKFLINKTIETLLTKYELDGIHLDYIRYPGLGFDYSESAVDSFIAEQTGTKIEKADLLSKHYMAWVNWRSHGITQLVKSIDGTIDLFSNQKIELSAALIANAAIEYRSQEKFGQNYSDLAHYLDLVIPMAYFKGERRPVEWISQVISSARYKIGNTQLLVGLAAYQQPNEWKITNKEFASTVKLAEKGSEGIVFYNYLNLFGHGKDQSWDMNSETIQFLSDHLLDIKKSEQQKHEVSLPEENPSFLGSKHNRLLLIGLVLLLLLSVFVIYYIRKKGLHGQDFSVSNYKIEDLNLSTVDFVSIEEKVQSGRNINSAVFTEISTILKEIGPQRISRFRQVYLLEILLEKSQPIHEVLQNISSNTDRYTCLRRIEEAGLLGYLEIDNDSQVSITELGRKLINQGKADGYSRGVIDFLDNRLSENIVISCSRCDAKTLGHWFWKKFECSGCHHKTDVAKSPNIFIRK